MQFKIGDRVTLQDDFDFYDATVKESDGDNLKIRFDGIPGLTTVLPEQFNDLKLLEEEEI